jgi:hypothetical protein
MEYNEVIEKFMNLAIITGSNDKLSPISFNGFKNRASIHRYGKTHKILFIGHPKHNLWGFYLPKVNDKDYLKAAYKVFIETLKGNMKHIDTGVLQWGNSGIPISYGKLRQSLFVGE